jgi:hypothetical protein
VRVLLHVLKNLLGLGLVALGLLLSLPGIPGQGLLTGLIGIMLLDFPGKRRLERKLVGMPRVLAAINRLRHRYGKVPLVLDHDGNGSACGAVSRSAPRDSVSTNRS